MSKSQNARRLHTIAGTLEQVYDNSKYLNHRIIKNKLLYKWIFDASLSEGGLELISLANRTHIIHSSPLDSQIFPNHQDSYFLLISVPRNAINSLEANTRLQRKSTNSLASISSYSIPLLSPYDLFRPSNSGVWIFNRPGGWFLSQDLPREFPEGNDLHVP